MHEAECTKVKDASNSESQPLGSILFKILSDLFRNLNPFFCFC